MEENMQHFCHIKLYYFKKGKHATETQKKVCAVYGEGAVTDRTCRKWFGEFWADFLLDDAPQLGRQLKLIAIKLRQQLRTIYVLPHGK